MTAMRSMPPSVLRLVRGTRRGRPGCRRGVGSSGLPSGGSIAVAPAPDGISGSATENELLPALAPLRLAVARSRDCTAAHDENVDLDSFENSTDPVARLRHLRD